MTLRRYALGLVGLIFCLLLLGGLVHNTRSSLACPDWPLCFGSAFPKMEGGVLVEHSHRLLATTVGLGTIGLLIGLWRRARRTGEQGLVKLGVIALLLVITQGVIGGITVIYRLPTLVSTTHLAVSMIFFSLVIYISFRLRDGERPPVDVPGLGRAALVAAIVVYVQMLIGALMRHLGAGLACTDVPFCAGGIWPTGAHPNVLLHATHRLAGLLVLCVTIWVAVVGRRARGAARWHALVAPALVLVQIILGLGSITTFLDVVPVTAHLGVAALLLADLFALRLLASDDLRAAPVLFSTPAPARALDEAAA